MVQNGRSKIPELVSIVLIVVGGLLMALGSPRTSAACTAKAGEASKAGACDEAKTETACTSSSGCKWNTSASRASPTSQAMFWSGFALVFLVIALQLCNPRDRSGKASEPPAAPKPPPVKANELASNLVDAALLSHKQEIDPLQRSAGAALLAQE